MPQLCISLRLQPFQTSTVLLSRGDPPQANGLEPEPSPRVLRG
ncbi:hypothetical protein KR100_09745 [Synechococcus sp. KORDI-100]|nr:hypothetical protein [Synechococcus sp. KORDI-100]AII43642.1 hypothetical protein KR100_09745 [Synechococcus sp. KORDI-100]